MKRPSRRYKRLHYNTPIKLWRYESDGSPLAFGDDNVPTNTATPVLAWTGRVYLSPAIFSRQRREWPDDVDYDGSQQDVAFYAIVAPFDMLPQPDDYVEELTQDGESLRFFSQVSPPKDAGRQGIYWHLDLGQPLEAAPA